MTAVRHVLYLLTVCAHVSATDGEIADQVKTMNGIFTCPGWQASTRLDDTQIVVQWMGNEKRIFSKRDLLATGGAGGQIVNSQNAECKIRQAHQLLSCHFARNLKMCYDYNYAVVHQCNRSDSSLSLLLCVQDFVEIIRTIDPVVVRYRGALSCIQKLSPATRFDQGAFKAMRDFKKHYDDLALVDANNHVAILTSLGEKLNTARQSLGEFYEQFCQTQPDKVENCAYGIAKNVEEIDERFTPLEAITMIKKALNTLVRFKRSEYDVVHSVGFGYDESRNEVCIKYKSDKSVCVVQ